MSTTDEKHVFALHRYFLQADQMRKHFRQTLGHGPEHFEERQIYQPLYMGLWYGSLYVVVEGWKEINLADPVVDELLASPYVELLKRYRHGVFHYQKTYHDNRFLDFMKPPDTPEWINCLHDELGGYFLAWFAQRRKEGQTSTR